MGQYRMEASSLLPMPLPLPLLKLGMMQGGCVEGKEEEQQQQEMMVASVCVCGGVVKRPTRYGPAWPSPPAKGSLVCFAQGQDP